MIGSRVKSKNNDTCVALECFRLQDGFTYRIGIQWWVVVVASVIAFLIAFITISTRAIKAAIAGPAKSLRSE